ncbi:MAG: SBBP repeat-containing protein [Chitinophagales bacterium]|nr:SBBP repeat-containing protein [Chitinophagales bacterium]
MKFTSTTNKRMLLKSLSISFFYLLIPFHLLKAQNHNFEWAYGIGGNLQAQDKAQEVYTDPAGNVYITGAYLGPADFDPSSGTTSLPSSFFDAYISKMDASGNLVWAKNFGGSNQDIGRSIAVDDAGNVYVAGDFYGSWVYDPGSGPIVLSSNGQNDAFISKFDVSGNLIWVKTFGGSLFEYAYGIDVDTSGNLYVTGSFWQTVDFDPGPGTTSLTANGNSDIFIAKYTSNGDLTWVKNIGANGANDGFDIKLDGNNNIYITGKFSGTVDFDPGVGTEELVGQGAQNVFVAKYDENGNYIWAEKIASNSLCQGNALALDAANNVYVSGYFQSTATLEQGAGTIDLVSTGDNDIFVAKYDENGGLAWAKGFGGLGNDRGEAISVDAFGNPYITGAFTETIDLNPSAGGFNLNSNGGMDGFIAAFNTNGNFTWGKNVGSTLMDYGTGISVDVFNNVYVTGDFSDTADLDPGVGVYEVVSNGSIDIFVMKLSCAPTYNTLSIDACDSYSFNGVVYTSNNNTATDTLVNAYGCDSILTLDLTITSIDVNTNLSGDTLSAVSTTATYQWMDCDNNTLLSGENGQSFIASQTGNYAVILSENGCSDTSACTSITISVGIRDLRYADLNIFPNPTSGKFEIANMDYNNEDVLLYDLTGKLVLRMQASSKSFDISNLEKGIYLLEIRRVDEILKAKLIKN